MAVEPSGYRAWRGIGKSSLLSRFAETVSREQVLLGRASALPGGEQDGLAPLPAAFSEVFTPLRVQQLTERIPDVLRAQLAPLIPAFSTATGDDSVFGGVAAPSAGAALETVLRRVLREVTALAPLVLLLDDLQWAGSAFWDMLPVFLTAARDFPVLVVGAFRPEAVDPAACWSGAPPDPGQGSGFPYSPGRSF